MISQDMVRSAYEMGRIEYLRFRKMEMTLGFSRRDPSELYPNLYIDLPNGTEVTLADILSKKNMMLTNAPSHETSMS